jgi:hypothetical protein
MATPRTAKVGHTTREQTVVRIDGFRGKLISADDTGVDAFDLKTDEGWRIAGGAYTVESKCEPSPLGPLKQ